MASKYQEEQRQRQINLLGAPIFEGATGGGYFKQQNRDFVLTDGNANLFAPIREAVKDFFSENCISWWEGTKPSGHLLSSQIACLNHLFHIRLDKKSVLKLLNGVSDEFIDVLPIACDKERESYISFEVISGEDYLNEGCSIRGSLCTSIDALIYAKHRSGELWLIPIEWKYTEHYTNQDKSTEDHPGETNKGLNGKGNKRLSRYTGLITMSEQLKSLPEYRSSVYFQEPFYQLMRQTLWAEQVIAHKVSPKEPLKADNYLHIHVIPKNNGDLLDKSYKISGKPMEDSWRACLTEQSKYRIIDPSELMHPVSDEYPELMDYLEMRYWG